MTKRADGKFERRPRDEYDTPAKAIIPLLDQLDPGTKFAEPCCGANALVDELEKRGHRCMHKSDIFPRADGTLMNAMFLTNSHIKDVDYIITNPPWDRPVLHPMINHFRKLAPTWLLLDADWMHTKQASEFLPYCSLISSVGRVSWMANGKAGFDNAAWYLFLPEETFTVFLGR